jgi:hypothetical protein
MLKPNPERTVEIPEQIFLMRILLRFQRRKDWIFISYRSLDIRETKTGKIEIFRIHFSIVDCLSQPKG